MVTVVVEVVVMMVVVKVVVVGEQNQGNVVEQTRRWISSHDGRCLGNIQVVLFYICWVDLALLDNTLSPNN